MFRILVLGALFATAVQAQPEAVDVHHVHDLACILSLGDGPAESSEDVLRASALATANGRTSIETVETVGASSTFIVTYSGFTPEAQAAFQLAVDVWADHVQSLVPIRVEANFSILQCTNQSCTLGAAGPLQVFTSFTNARLSTAYPSALANAIAGRDLSPDVKDIRATFNSNYPAPGTNFRPFYFGLDGNPPPGQIDFTTVVLHELGHGLGFFGSGRFEAQSSGTECNGLINEGCYGFSFSGGGFEPRTIPVVFDRFLEDRERRPMTNLSVYPNPSVALGTLLQSEDLYINGENVRRVADQSTPIVGRPEAWAPSTFERGSSYSHWDEEQFFGGSPNALMTPRLGAGEVYRTPGALTCAFFQDMGWPLGPGCESLTSTAGEGGVDAAGGGLALAGPNPFRGATAVQVTLDAPQFLEVAVYDALGRRVETLSAAEATAGPHTFSLDGSRLPPGVYVVRAGGATLRVVRVR